MKRNIVIIIICCYVDISSSDSGVVNDVSTDPNSKYFSPDHSKLKEKLNIHLSVDYIIQLIKLRDNFIIFIFFRGIYTNKMKLCLKIIILKNIFFNLFYFQNRSF